MKKRNLYIPFHMNLRADLISDNTINKLLKLKNVGLDTIFIGFESFNEKDLTLYGKKSSLDDNKSAVNMLNKYGLLNGVPRISCNYGFINFNPYSTIETLKSNLDFLIDNNMNFALSTMATKMFISGSDSIVKKMYGDGLILQDIKLPIINKEKYKFKHLEIKHIYELTKYCADKIKPLHEYGTIFPLYRSYIELNKNPHKFDIFVEKYVGYEHYSTKSAKILYEFILNNYSRNDIKEIIDNDYKYLFDTILRMQSILDMYKIKISRELYKNNKLVV